MDRKFEASTNALRDESASSVAGLVGTTFILNETAGLPVQDYFDRKSIVSALYPSEADSALIKSMQGDAATDQVKYAIAYQLQINTMLQLTRDVLLRKRSRLQNQANAASRRSRQSIPPAANVISNITGQLQRVPVDYLASAPMTATK